MLHPVLVLQIKKKYIHIFMIVIMEFLIDTLQILTQNFIL